MTAEDSSGNVGTHSVTVHVLGPKELIESVRAELADYPTARRKLSSLLEEIIKRLDKSLSESYWLNETRLKQYLGKMVFIEGAFALEKMILCFELLKKEATRLERVIRRKDEKGLNSDREKRKLATLNDELIHFGLLIENLPAAYESIARLAIEDAFATQSPGNERRFNVYSLALAKAGQAYEKAQELLEENKPGMAITSYKHAWQLALQAIHSKR